MNQIIHQLNDIVQVLLRVNHQMIPGQQDDIVIEVNVIRIMKVNYHVVQIVRDAHITHIENIVDSVREIVAMILVQKMKVREQEVILVIVFRMVQLNLLIRVISGVKFSGDKLKWVMVVFSRHLL